MVNSVRISLSRVTCLENDLMLRAAEREFYRQQVDAVNCPENSGQHKRVRKRSMQSQVPHLQRSHAGVLLKPFVVIEPDVIVNSDTSV